MRFCCVLLMQQKKDLKREGSLLEEFECGVCYECFNPGHRFPLNLSCGHTFCQQCIALIIATQPKFRCPLCNTTHKDLRLGQCYRNFALLRLMEVQGFSQGGKKEIVVGVTFADIVTTLDKLPRNTRHLVIKRTRDDEANPFDNDLIRSNRHSMRFYRLLIAFQQLETFEFWVKFSAHGFEECLADALAELPQLKSFKIVNAYDEYDRLKEIIPLLSNGKIEISVFVQKWE